MDLSKFQKILTTVLAATAVISIGYGVYCHFAKASELQVTNQNVAQMFQEQQKFSLHTDIKFLYFQLDRLESDYYGKPKDLRYEEKKRSLERQIRAAEDQLKRLKAN